MAPPKPRHHIELDLSTLVPDGTPLIGDTLSNLQMSLETLLSDQSHPIATKLRRQLDVLKNAESIILHETEVRKSQFSVEDNSAKRKHSELENSEDAMSDDSDEDKNELSRKNSRESSSDSDNSVNGNGKFVPNPKAEFVDAQTLPLELYTEPADIGSDEEAIKRRLGVVSYPKEDLSTLTAGPVPMEDFTGPRPANQVLFSTYSAFIEPYFRQFTEDDLILLQQPLVSDGMEATNLLGGKKLSPFTIPPLGPHYKYYWTVQDAELSGMEVADNVRGKHQADLQRLANSYVPLKGTTDISSANIEFEDKSVSLGPFSERLIAAVMPDLVSTEWDLEAENIPPSTSMLQPIDDYSHLEERVKGEFRYVGLLDMGLLRQFDRQKNQFKLALPQPKDEFSDPTTVEVDWVNGNEDDEVCRELRVLQRKLKEVNKRNNFYKQRLIGPVQELLAWQEYQSILQDLDKQVDQGYQRKLKAPKAASSKNKKKVKPEDEIIEQKLPDQNLAIKAVMNKRERWINKIGPLFKPAYEMMRGYETPKFSGLENVGDFDDEDYEES